MGGPEAACKRCSPKHPVALRLFWVQAGQDAWQLRGRCSTCGEEAGVLKQTEENVRHAPAKQPQGWLFGGPAP